MKLLNVGCGEKLAKCGSWTNVDMIANPEKGIVGANFLKGLPFESNKFSVVYQSQVLEHFQKKDALPFILECKRVMSKGGVIRIVVPDLELLVRSYLEILEKCSNNETEISRIQYEWVLLRIYDQSIRNKPGGMMSEFLQNISLKEYHYISNNVGRIIHNMFTNKKVSNKKRIFKFIRKFFHKPVFSLRRLINILIELFSGKYRKIGKFRLGGEIHYWMYDFYSLKKLLQEAGFKDIKKVSPSKSSIPDWNKFELDIINGKVCDPDSLFVEATNY